MPKAVSPIVLDPPSKDRIEPLGDVSQRQLRLTTEFQVPNRGPYGFNAGGLTAGLNPQNSLLALRVLHQAGPETIPEEVKLDVRVRSPSPVVLAVDDLGFVGCSSKWHSARRA